MIAQGIAAAFAVAALWRVRSRVASSRSKPVVALDLDEVLGAFLPALIRFHNDKYGTEYKLDDFFSYRFCDVWGGTNEETLDKIFEFFKTDYFLKDLKPIPGAHDVLQEFKDKFDFVVVTSRQHEITEETRHWLDQHFHGIISRAEFGNHWAKDAPDPEDDHHSKRSKKEMCQEVGAILLIDDNMSYCKEVSQELGIPAVLFGDYGWNQGDVPSKVTRLPDWQAVRQYLREL